MPVSLSPREAEAVKRRCVVDMKRPVYFDPLCRVCYEAMRPTGGYTEELLKRIVRVATTARRYERARQRRGK